MLTDVVVVGGGVIGLTVAVRLKLDGLDVTVVDQAGPGDGASMRAAGVLAPLLDQPKPTPLVALGHSSLVRWPTLVADLDLGDRIRIARGVLVAAESDQHAAELAALLPTARTVDPGAALWDAATVREHVLGLGRHVRGGLFYPEAAWIDPAEVLSALYRRARELGVRMRWGVPALGVEVRGDRVRGVRIAGGVVPGGAVVVAAGAWAGQLFAAGSLMVPIYPVGGTLATVTGAPTPPWPVFGRGRYVVPRPDGRLVLGGTEARRGFRQSPTAAATRAVLDTLDLYPAAADGTVDSVRTGLRPASPDGLPLIGPWPEMGGLFVAGGHFRTGWLLAPVTADLIAASVFGDPWPIDPTPFRPDRFRDDDWPNWLEP